MPYLCFDGMAVKIDDDLAAKLPKILKNLADGQYTCFQQELGNRGVRLHLTGSTSAVITPDTIDVSKLTVIT